MTSAEDNERIPEDGVDTHDSSKAPLKNGIHDQPQIIKDTDKTDDVVYHADDLEDPLNSMLAKRNKKRKYKTYDNGKRNRINLSPLTSNGIRFEKIIKQKTGLTRTGLVLAILCIVLAIALLVCIILWPKSHSKEYPVCTKPSCLRSSAEILSKLNVNESVCNNLQNYACGSWFTSNPLPKDRSEWNMKELLQFKYRHKVHELIHTMPVATDSSSLMWKLKTAYDSCMSVSDIRSDNDLRAIIQDLGGWEVLHDFSVSSWDARKALTMLYARYSVSPFFIIDVVPDVTDSHRNIIRLRPPKLGLPNKNYYSLSDSDPVIVSYKHFIQDIVRSFGATLSDATKFGESMFYFEKRIAEIFDSDDIPSTNYTRITIGDLSQILLQIPLYDILMGKFPQANLKGTDYLLISSSSYFRNLAKFLSYTDLTSLNNYSIWRLIYEFLPYFPQKYIETIDLYKKEFTGETESMPRWEFCIATLQKFAGFGLLSLYESKMQDKEGVNSVVSDLFGEILNVIKKHILSNKRNEYQSSLVDKVNQLGVQIGFPPHMMKPKYLNLYYSSLNAMKYDFFQTVIFGLNFIKDDMQRRLTNPLEEYRWIDNMASQPTSVTFNSDVDKVIVPSAVLQPPFFEKEYSLPALYGGIGAEISKAIVSSFVIDKTYYENGKKMISNQSSSYEVDSNTLQQYISDCILYRNFANLNITDKQLLVSTLTGIKYAYKSLKKELSTLNIHTQPALENYGSEELFYIINVQSSCSIKSTKKENHESVYTNTFTDKFLTNAISTYSSEFTDLFSCGEKSSYYESSLCR